MPSEPVSIGALVPEVDVDSLAAAHLARVDTLPVEELPALEEEIRDWLARLQYEDPRLLPLGHDPGPYFRRRRGLLLDALGRSAFRRGDLRQSEAALVSAAEEIHHRGTTEGYARHLHHLGELHAARGRWARAVDAFLAAEARGMGAGATPALEGAYRRLRGSLRGLEERRTAERARIEDERRQLLVADPASDPLPSFSWPRRTGAPIGNADLIGGTSVIALWDERCPECPRWAEGLEPLARALRRRGAKFVAAWLGEDPADAGPLRPYPVALPRTPLAARRGLGVGQLPALVVVDATGRIRYRHAGAAPPPVEAILIQVDHLERRRR